MAQHTSRLKDYLENLPLRGLYALTRPLSARWRNRVVGWIGRQLISLVPATRRRVTDNLTLIYPDMPPADRQALLGRYGAMIARTFVEMRYSRDLIAAADRIDVAGEENFDLIRQAQEAGRGVILVSGHFGQWEAIRAVFRHRGLNCSAVFREHDNHYFNKDMVPHFQRYGTPLFPKGKAGLRGLIQHLRGGGITAVLLDQKVWGGEVLDFMGQPATTATGMAELALRYDLLLIPAYGIRLPDLVNYRVEFEPPVPHSDPVTMTQVLNDSLAAQVRKRPDQWHWAHRRWADTVDPRTQEK